MRKTEAEGHCRVGQWSPELTAPSKRGRSGHQPPAQTQRVLVHGANAVHSPGNPTPARAPHCSARPVPPHSGPRIPTGPPGARGSGGGACQRSCSECRGPLSPGSATPVLPACVPAESTSSQPRVPCLEEWLGPGQPGLHLTSARRTAWWMDSETRARMRQKKTSALERGAQGAWLPLHERTLVPLGRKRAGWWLCLSPKLCACKNGLTEAFPTPRGRLDHVLEGSGKPQR